MNDETNTIESEAGVQDTGQLFALLGVIVNKCGGKLTLTREDFDALVDKPQYLTCRFEDDTTVLTLTQVQDENTVDLIKAKGNQTKH